MSETNPHGTSPRMTEPQPISNALERPDSRLLAYYALSSLIVPPLFPFAFAVLYFRYHTLRYRFDPEGISMRWGILFRREILLNYARIQDIQIRANLVERWLGLARIEIQTAAGNAGAEMTLEGFRNFEAVRDFIYQRMRGVREGHARITTATAPLLPNPPVSAPDPSHPDLAALAVTLRDVATELRHLRESLAHQETRHD